MTDYVPKITDFLQFKLTLGNLIEERLGDITREEREPLVDTTIYFRNGLASTNLQRQPHNVVPSHIIDRINNLLKSVNLAEVDDLLDFNGNLTWDGVHGDIYCRFAMEVAVVFEVSVWSVDPLGFLVKMHEKNTVPAPEMSDEQSTVDETTSTVCAVKRFRDDDSSSSDDDHDDDGRIIKRSHT